MRRLSSCLILAYIQLVFLGSAYATCAESGLNAYRSQGHSAAAEAFGRALETPECRTDQLTLLNYARSIEAISTKDKNGPLACEAAELLRRVENDRTAAAEIVQMASAGADRLSLSCTVLAPNTDASYTALLARAQAAQVGKRPFHRRLALDAAVRLAPERSTAHRRLCQLLAPTHAAEARRHCDQVDALARRTPAHTTQNNRAAWVWTGLSATLLGAGLTAYFLAKGAADDAFDWNDKARQASERRDYPAYLSANQRQEASIDEARQLQITGWSLLGAGAAAVGLATYYWLDGDGVKLAIGPNHISFGVMF